jgi:phenylalanyl-tRNA synthetase beta chain
MRISYQWLSQYVDVPAPEELARRLTAVGLEVEAIERMGQGLEGVFAARIVASEPHPNAEKLSVTRVDAGAGEPLQVVCGAKNYQVGDVVPLARVGASLPGGLHIQKAKLRGVESFGMLCSAKELGLDADASGLLILPRDVAPGTPIAKVLGLDDALLEVNVTPNRPDALSHVGLAREVAAILGGPLRPPAPKLVEQGAPAAEAVRVRIEAPVKCARDAARVIEGVKIGPSPGWLARRLESCGVRSISNVVDATNFVLLELGHPLHAFDLDRVAGHEIVVRTARPGERITTLDGKERALEPDDLLIADRDRGSALGGVMGGGDSEISGATTRVLLESAWFEASGVRRTSKRHQLRTEASLRFERGADPGAVIPALDRCAALIAELAGGTVRPGIVDAHPRDAKQPEVTLRWARPGEVLGTPVSRETARRILHGLGFHEWSADDAGAVFGVPTWRMDVSREEDLVEEIVRMQGYDGIPETLPGLAAAETPAVPADEAALARAREALESAGFSEAVNFSFVAPADLAAFDPASRPIALANPITAELAVMRTSLVPSLLRNVSFNLRSGAEGGRLYEIARTYSTHETSKSRSAQATPALEPARLAAVAFGRNHPHHWSGPDSPLDFFDVKGALEGLLEALGCGPASFRGAGRELAWLHPRSACVVELGGARVAALGELHPRVAAAFDLPRGVLALEADLDALLASARLVREVRPVSRFPAVTRDIAMLVDEAVPAGEVQRVLDEAAKDGLVEETTLYDDFRGGALPRGKKNLAVYVRWRALDRTLTDEEADALRARIVERLRTDPAIRAELRA